MGVCVCFPYLSRFSFFHTKPRDCLGEMSPKWPILCRVGHKIVKIQSVNLYSNWSFYSAQTDWAIAILVSLQPITSWCWRAWQWMRPVTASSCCRSVLASALWTAPLEACVQNSSENITMHLCRRANGRCSASNFLLRTRSAIRQGIHNSSPIAECRLHTDTEDEMLKLDDVKTSLFAGPKKE